MPQVGQWRSACNAHWLLTGAPKTPSAAPEPLPQLQLQRIAALESRCPCQCQCQYQQPWHECYSSCSGVQSWLHCYTGTGSPSGLPRPLAAQPFPSCFQQARDKKRHSLKRMIGMGGQRVSLVMNWERVRKQVQVWRLGSCGHDFQSLSAVTPVDQLCSTNYPYHSSLVLLSLFFVAASPFFLFLPTRAGVFHWQGACPPAPQLYSQARVPLLTPQSRSQHVAQWTALQ